MAVYIAPGVKSTHYGPAEEARARQYAEWLNDTPRELGQVARHAIAYPLMPLPERNT